MHNPYASPGLSDAPNEAQAGNPYASAVDIREIDGDAPYQPSLFSFNGRIGRLRLIAYSLPAAMLWASAIALIESTTGFSHRLHPTWAQISLLLLSALPFLVISRRRLHDLNHSGRWLLLCLTPLSPILGLFLLLGAGTQGRNNYGSPPEENHPAVYALALAVLFIIVAAIALPPYMIYQARQHVVQDQ